MQNNVIIFNLWWCRNNYGAILTAFALQEIIKSFNKNPYSFDDFGIGNKKIFGENFSKKYINVCNKNNSYCDAENLNNFTDTFIAGSDQIFRSGLLYEKFSKYFLNFAEINKKKIAFSASFGIDKEGFFEETPQNIIEKTKNSLKSFDFISVREKSGVEICKDVFNLDAEWIIDPVFILDKSRYNKLIKDSTKDYKNKIVSYVLDSGIEYKRVYKYLSQKYDKKVIKTANSNISVENWLASIRDCDLFVTDSFHGMCFAIIFNKPFICLANKSRGKSRFDSICEMLGVENQCIDSILEVMQNDCIFKIDYNMVNQRIAEECSHGLEFLKKALDAPTNVTQEKINTRIKYLEKRVTTLEKQNNLSYQMKNFLWKRWLVMYHCYLPKFAKRIISLFWPIIKGDRK